MERITTTFGFRSTAAEVVAGIDLSGRRAIVTGGASGIGIETARALAGAGAEVTLAVRDVDAGARTAADIAATTGNHAVHVGRLELTDGSIAAFVAGWDGPLHLLVNNAGVMAMPEEHTAAGREMQFATNHLGHFALALGLHDALAQGAPSRIVAVSSHAHLRSPVVFDDLDFAFRPYDPWAAYGQCPRRGHRRAAVGGVGGAGRGLSGAAPARQGRFSRRTGAYGWPRGRRRRARRRRAGG